MLTVEQKERLSIIFGDDMESVGDVVIIRDDESKMVNVVNNEGEALLPHPVYGIGMFLGPGGFNYIVLTRKKDTEQKSRGGITTTRRSYTYNVYDSKFNWVSVKETISSGMFGYESMELDMRGKMIKAQLSDGILKAIENRFYF